MNNFKKTLLIVAVTMLFAVAALGSSSSDSSSSSSTTKSTEAISKKIEITAEQLSENEAEENETDIDIHNNEYIVNVHIDFISNWIFDTYNVEIYVDSQKIDTLSHGTDADFELTIRGGEHTFKFVSEDDSLISGKVDLNVDSDIDVTYKINCYIDEVSVKTEFEDHKIELSENQIKMDRFASDFEGKNYEAVSETLAELGFTNIEIQADYDIVFGITKEGSVESVSINGNTDFRRADVFEKDASVVITYHMKVEDDPTVSESTANSTTSKNDDKPEKYDVDKDLVVAMCEKDKKYTTRYNITFVENDSNGNPIRFYTFDSCVNPKDMGKEFNAIGELPSWFYVGATVHVQANMSGDALLPYKCAVTPIKSEQVQTTVLEEKTMPVMSGTNLDTIVDTAKSYGLTQPFSDENWGHGTKMKTFSSSNGGLTMDVVYSSSSKEILSVSIVTFNTITLQEQLEFIEGISKVACPTDDTEKVSSWVSENIGQEATETISGFVYELSFGPNGNALYNAGMANWEEWELSFD